jgi:voltage-gated potassium channel
MEDERIRPSRVSPAVGRPRDCPGGTPSREVRDGSRAATGAVARVDRHRRTRRCGRMGDEQRGCADRGGFAVTVAPAGPGRQRNAVAAIRAVLTAGMLLAVYYQAPLDRRIDVQVLVWLSLGLVGLGAALIWQVRAIMSSDAPRLQAAETVAIGLPTLLLLYASAYSVLSLQDPVSFTQRLGRTDALYFTMTVFTTVGFGDITPVSQAARVLTMTQMVVGLVAVGAVAKLLVGAVHVAVDRRKADEAAAGTTVGDP